MECNCYSVINGTNSIQISLDLHPMWRLLTVPMRGMSHCPGPCPLKVEEGYSLFDLWTGLLCKWGRQKREKVTETSCTWGVMWPQQLWRIFIPGESMKWGSCPVTKPGKHRLMLFLSTLQQLVGSHECQFVAMHNNNNNNNNNNKTMTKQWQKTNKKNKTCNNYIWPCVKSTWDLFTKCQYQEIITDYHCM